LLILSAFSAAQAGPKYNPSTESKFKGVVEELKLPPKGNPKDVAHLMIKNGDDVLDIYLCPKAFMDDMGVTFAKGDEIAFTGASPAFLIANARLLRLTPGAPATRGLDDRVQRRLRGCGRYRAFGGELVLRHRHRLRDG